MNIHLEDDFYSRYRLARTPEEKQKGRRRYAEIHLGRKKVQGVIPPITATAEDDESWPIKLITKG
jgi:hypothetical protein